MDADEERSCHDATSSITRADDTVVYDLPADVIETTPNVLYGECIDGIQMKPHETTCFTATNLLLHYL